MNKIDRIIQQSRAGRPPATPAAEVSAHMEQYHAKIRDIQKTLACEALMEGYYHTLIQSDARIIAATLTHIDGEPVAEGYVLGTGDGTRDVTRDGTSTLQFECALTGECGREAA